MTQANGLLRILAPAFLALTLIGCPGTDGTGEDTGDEDHEDEDHGDEDDHDHEDELELITRVVLDIEDEANNTQTAEWSDPELDGNPDIDVIELAPNATYNVNVSFFNDTEDPAENITTEIAEEDAEHQIFVSTDVATYAYTDMDANGLPVGLAGTITTGEAGTGDMRLILRHLPAENDMAVKVDGLSDDFAANGVTGLPGESDVDIEFPVEVTAP